MGIATDLVRPGKFTPESLCSCSICLDILVNPVDLKDCQHTFCKECIDEYIKKSTKDSRDFNVSCPKCRKKIKKRSDVVQAHLFLRSLLSEIMLECKFKCGEVVQYGQFEKHVDMCEDNPKNFVSCEPCAAKMSQKKLWEHQQNCLPHCKKTIAELRKTVEKQKQKISDLEASQLNRSTWDIRIPEFRSPPSFSFFPTVPTVSPFSNEAANEAGEAKISFKRQRKTD